jgi:hypothetical protein
VDDEWDTKLAGGLPDRDRWITSLRENYVGIEFAQDSSGPSTTVNVATSVSHIGSDSFDVSEFGHDAAAVPTELSRGHAIILQALGGDELLLG